MFCLKIVISRANNRIDICIDHTQPQLVIRNKKTEHNITSTIKVYNEIKNIVNALYPFVSEQLFF